MPGETILVIDDDPKVVRSLQYGLDKYKFIGAANAKEGLSILRKPHGIHLVLLDVMMPQLKGTKVLPMIKKMGLGLGVIMLTGCSTKDVLKDCLRGGADDFIEKPFSICDVKEKIERILKKTRFKGMGERRSSKERILKAKRYIDFNPDKKITLQHLSKIACISPKYLSRVFQIEVGQSITAYRLNLRMQHAKTLLKGTDIKVDDLAGRLGYENSDCFMKMFKKIVGITPTEYRIQARQHLNPSPSLPSHI